jgi:biopolymer transport protein ExbB
MQADLSVWGMYQHADIVVKIVMIGLILASVVTWAIFFSKSAELLSQKRRLKREQQQLAEARSLDQASDMTSSFHAKSLTTLLVNEAQNELELSAGSEDNEGIKERTGFRLERRVAAVGRHMGRGNGYLATIGAISPFIGLVWYGLGHHEQLYRYCADPNHQPGGGGAGYRRSAAGDGNRSGCGNSGGGYL